MAPLGPPWESPWGPYIFYLVWVLFLYILMNDDDDDDDDDNDFSIFSTDADLGSTPKISRSGPESIQNTRQNQDFVWNVIPD